MLNRLKDQQKVLSPARGSYSRSNTCNAHTPYNVMQHKEQFSAHWHHFPCKSP
uniref:Uncharacterized protein n=1 Tax=Arundo donax TaxID=35708 RepID=A0A0A9DEQ0_ARUDO